MLSGLANQGSEQRRLVVGAIKSLNEVREWPRSPEVNVGMLLHECQHIVDRFRTYARANPTTNEAFGFLKEIRCSGDGPKLSGDLSNHLPRSSAKLHAIRIRRKL